MSSEKESDPALARKRRKARLQRKRPLSLDEKEPDEVPSYNDESTPDDHDGPRKKPHITGIKKDARYDPGVKMTREELREWRKEARRVRNRESAAASRRRTRDRTSELESQVQVLETKYAAALQRIVELEAAAAVNETVAASPATTSQDQEEAQTSRVSPCPSQTSSPSMTPTPVSPTASPRDIFSLNRTQDLKMETKFQHLTEMISTA